MLFLSRLYVHLTHLADKAVARYGLAHTSLALRLLAVSKYRATRWQVTCLSARQGRSPTLMLNIPPTSHSLFNNLGFIFPSSSCVNVCVSDVRQKLEAPQKEKHKKNKEKHKTKKEHRRRKEKVSNFRASWTACRLWCPCFCHADKPPGVTGEARQGEYLNIWWPRWGHTGLSIPWQECGHSCTPSICRHFVFLSGRIF